MENIIVNPVLHILAGASDLSPKHPVDEWLTHLSVQSVQGRRGGSRWQHDAQHLLLKLRICGAIHTLYVIIGCDKMGFYPDQGLHLQPIMFLHKPNNHAKILSSVVNLLRFTIKFISTVNLQTDVITD